jgi:hypothetical protein
MRMWLDGVFTLGTSNASSPMTRIKKESLVVATGCAILRFQWQEVDFDKFIA